MQAGEPSELLKRAEEAMRLKQTISPNAKFSLFANGERYDGTIEDIIECIRKTLK
jgi:hypothetical protein